MKLTFPRKGLHSSSLKAWLLHNPYAGRFPPRPFVERTVRTLRRLGWEVHAVESPEPQEVSRLAAACAAEGCDVLFVAGGDGTIGQAASGLAGTPTALGVLPSGTGNVFAQELGLAGLGYTGWFALEEAARRLAAGRLATMDLGRCNGRLFLLWAGVGLDGYVIRRIEPRPRLAKTLAVPYYVSAAAWAARDWRGIELRVTVDGQTVSGRFGQAVVTNIRRYGGGLFRLAPEARADDGLLDVWLLPGDDFNHALMQVWRLMWGQHVRHPAVKSLRGREISLEADAPACWQLDGEAYPASQRFEIGVWPRALNVLLPAEPTRPSLFQSTAFRRLPSIPLER